MPKHKKHKERTDDPKSKQHIAVREAIARCSKGEEPTQRRDPTVKPVVMLEDALLDMTERGDIVIDPFLGSGSTLIACEKTGRRCRGVELDPLYVELILRRYEAVTGQPAVLESTGETYAELTVRRHSSTHCTAVSWEQTTTACGGVIASAC